MRNCFAALVATSASVGYPGVAAIPRQCFFVTDIHENKDMVFPGSKQHVGHELVSDLPYLMEKYEPGMLAENIIALIDEDWGVSALAGLKLTLRDSSKGKKKLSLNNISPYSLTDLSI